MEFFFREGVIKHIDHQLTSWIILGWNDIKNRYRRTILGPFWIVLNTAISIGFLGIVYKTIFKLPPENFLPYIAAGIVVWNLIFINTSESCTSFISHKYLLQGIPIRPELIIVRLVFRNMIIFLHNVLVVIFILIIFGKGFSPHILLIVPGLFLILLNAVFLGIILAYLSARFRDLPQMINSILSIMFLITPVIWPRRLLGDSQLIAILNPATHMIAIIREPLLGAMPPLSSWVVVFINTIVLGMCSVVVSRSFRYRLNYWL